MPCSAMSSLRSERASASSLKRSARISRAPASASAKVGTAGFNSAVLSSGLLSTMYCSASFSTSAAVSSRCSQIKLASGSRPRSLAIVPRVRRLGRKGAKISSSRVIVSASATFFFNSAESSFRSSRLLTIASRRFSRSASCCSRSRTSMIFTSSIPPVCSLR